MFEHWLALFNDLVRHIHSLSVYRKWIQVHKAMCIESTFGVRCSITTKAFHVSSSLSAPLGRFTIFKITSYFYDMFLPFWIHMPSRVLIFQVRMVLSTKSSLERKLSYSSLVREFRRNQLDSQHSAKPWLHIQLRIAVHSNDSIKFRSSRDAQRVCTSLRLFSSEGTNHY